jgi:hypothetical protein
MLICFSYIVRSLCSVTYLDLLSSVSYCRLTIGHVLFNSLVQPLLARPWFCFTCGCIEVKANCLWSFSELVVICKIEQFLIDYIVNEVFLDCIMILLQSSGNSWMTKHLRLRHWLFINIDFPTTLFAASSLLLHHFFLSIDIGTVPRTTLPLYSGLEWRTQGNSILPTFLSIFCLALTKICLLQYQSFFSP